MSVSMNSGNTSVTAAYFNFLRNLCHDFDSRRGICRCIAVHTQGQSVRMHDQSKPTVPLPDGSGTNEGSDGLVPLAAIRGNHEARQRSTKDMRYNDDVAKREWQRETSEWRCIVYYCPRNAKSLITLW